MNRVHAPGVHVDIDGSHITHKAVALQRAILLLLEENGEHTDSSQTPTMVPAESGCESTQPTLGLVEKSQAGRDVTRRFCPFINEAYSQ